MDAHMLMYYIALTLGHMQVSGGLINRYKALHTIFTILHLLHKYQLLPCTLISRSPAFIQEIGRVCDKRLREAWE